MTADEAIDALSEKEREALRLLLAGHDAKSSARMLGVSHFAIHDRLRRARLKLGTTGSRQAALLLSEAEKETPDSVVHEPIGGVAAAAPFQDPSSADLKRPGPSGSSWRSKGLIIMSVSILIAAAAIALTGQGDAPRKHAEASEVRDSSPEALVARPAPTPDPARPAEPVAPVQAQSASAGREFMVMVDAGDAAASYAAAAPTFRSAHGYDLWRLGVAMRASDGGARRRTLVDVEREGDPVNPAHEALEILTFDTMMLNGERKSERLVMSLIDGRWQVASIDIEDFAGE